MAKNIKLRDLLNEDDVPIMKRIGNKSNSIDRYLTNVRPNKDGEYELDPRLAKGIEKAIGQDATAVSTTYTGKARLQALEGRPYLAPNGLEYPQFAIGGIPNKFNAFGDNLTMDIFQLDLSATPNYPLLKANPPKLTSADAKIIVTKGRTEAMREYDIEQIAEKIYNAKGHFSDEEGEVKKAMTSYRFGIQSRGDFAFLENTFINRYGKTLEHYLYLFFERESSEAFLKWMQTLPWMTKDVIQRYGDSLDRVNDWALATGTINDHFLFAISPTRMAFLKKNYAARDASALAKIPVLNWLSSQGMPFGTISGAEWTSAGQPGNEGQLLPYDINVHIILNALSFVVDFIPVIGYALSAGLDLLDAQIYVAEGDTYSAGLSAMFAVMPFVSGLPMSLVKSLKGFSKADLIKFGAKLGKNLDAATYLQLSRRELELLYEVEKAGSKLAKGFDDALLKGALRNSDEFAKSWKALSKSQQDELTKSIWSIRNTNSGKTALKYLEENMVMTAAEWAWRKANQVTDSDISVINEELIRDAQDRYSNMLKSALVAESTNSTWYSGFMKPNYAWQSRSVKNQQLSLQNILSEVLNEQNFKYVRDKPREFSDKLPLEDPTIDSTSKAASKDTTKSSSTIGQKQDTNQVFVKDKNTGETKLQKPKEAQEAAQEDESSWISPTTLVYLLAIGSTLVGVAKMGGVGVLLGSMLSKFFPGLAPLFSRTTGRFSPTQWIKVWRDRKKMREALNKSGLTLTRSEYKAMCRASNTELNRVMHDALAEVRAGTMSPEEAVKYFSGLQRGNTYSKLEDLKKVQELGQRRKATTGRSSSSSSTGTTTSSTMSGSPIGMPAGTVMSINQRIAFQNNPNLTWNQLKQR